MKTCLPFVAGFLSIAMLFSGCETPGQSALAGAATGAALGGIIGGRGRDALAGAAIGAGAGYLIGKVAQHERRYHEGEAADLPYAEPTDRYGFVTSPYRPYNLIDVRGIPHGAEVVDPSCGRAFINP
ncbi:MAG TPA: glycine zipper domain-containing protein [Chthoniobacteraceae bacterium]|nr:glycine zipper domain-containing protein [Chthoniobacteraceae bacterium]